MNLYVCIILPSTIAKKPTLTFGPGPKHFHRVREFLAGSSVRALTLITTTFPNDERAEDKCQFFLQRDINFSLSHFLLLRLSGNIQNFQMQQNYNVFTNPVHRLRDKSFQTIPSFLSFNSHITNFISSTGF